MMTDDQILEVVQAHKEGKKIESRLKNECDYHYGLGWLPLPVGTTIFWNFIKVDYRVAPEPHKPREWWIVSDGNESWKAYNFEPTFAFGFPAEIIKVREVIG